ncbi:hypothetical protein KUTeg_021642 [Tegillarca granosa]|uniref:ADF-H domain-containing protein n=1 Tax=Tegillarca granosa TaxID=220873 RepID=A0ABQ9E3W9_TEGGR|nr:hypothetical protein KUTeg_021642 [Tegillarca granosa]
MSTRAEFVEDANFAECIKSVRDDTTEDNYVLVGHVNHNPNQLTVIQVGQNVEDLQGLLDDSQVMLGDKVPFVKKGKYGVVHGSVQEKFNPYHLFIETSTVDDLNTETILQQLEENTGKKSKVIETTEGRQERGFTQSQLPKRGPAAKSGPELAKGGAKIDFVDDVLEYIADVRSDDTDTKWMLAEYQDGNPKGPIIAAGKGSGDISELKDTLSENDVMYGLYRVTDTVDDITTTKFVYINWIGSKTKPMTKAKVSTHKGAAEEIFGPAHVTIFATDMSDISEHIVMDKY